MNKVVIDLEFCTIGKNMREQRRISNYEIIQLGAVKLDDDDHIIDSFDLLVRPEFSVINERVTELTHITPEMVENELGFTDVMTLFLDWIGEEETTLYAWSKSDEHVLRREAALKGFRDEHLEALLEGCEDLQMMFTASLGLDKPISLSAAVQAGDLHFDGQMHSASADAYNTAVLYQIMADRELFRSFYDAALDLLTPKAPLTFSLGGLFTPEMLALCAG